jgi:hypothetical protein
MSLDTRVPEHRDPLEARNDAGEQLQTFGAHFGSKQTQAGDITARMPQTGDEPCRHRIYGQDRRDDRDVSRAMTGGGSGRCVTGDDDVRS